MAQLTIINRCGRYIVNSKKERKMSEETVNPEIVEAMGVSEAAFQEICQIVGRMPTVGELSTLLAMWEANGKQQSLHAWLRCQPHTVEYNDYLYEGVDEGHKGIHEPRVKECIAIAESLAKSETGEKGEGLGEHGDLIYMVGNVSSIFLDSEYARKYLHLAEQPIEMATPREEMEYIEMILDSLRGNEVIYGQRMVGEGGLFGTLMGSCDKQHGFDILTCREVRLDAFLFGEERGRYIVSLKESQDDFFLTKMDEARLNCCFLGRVTRGRILVDDMDFGPSTRYMRK